jgi:ribosomal subunit interface protein
MRMTSPKATTVVQRFRTVRRPFDVEKIMSLQVTGKNIEVGDSFKTYVEDKLDDAIEKYVGQHLTAHVRVEKERGRFHTSCSVRLRTGLLLEAGGEGTDAYASADAAFEHLEKRLRRYKRRLKSHHHGANGVHDATEVKVNDFVVQLEDESADLADATEPAGEHALVIAETERALRVVAVSEAVMQLDLTDEPFLVFRNAANRSINVVYRRKDGNIGWIDPDSPAKADGNRKKS